MSDALVELLAPTLQKLIVVGVFTVVGFVVKWIDGKTKDTRLHDYWQILKSQTTTAVMAAIQTSVEGIKQQYKDGKLTETEYKSALVKVKTGVIKSVKDTFPENGVKLFNKANIDLDTAIDNLIEEGILTKNMIR